MKELLFLSVFLILASCAEKPADNAGWKVAGGDYYRTQFSTLHQIDSSNASELRQAWVYRTGDTIQGSQIQCNPVIIDGTLYATTPGLRLFALNAENGSEKWVFDPAASGNDGSPGMNVNRGVSYWTDGREQRILYVAGPKLISVDAHTGIPDKAFGDGGYVDLRNGFERDVSSLYITATSPGVVYKDLLIIGSRVSEANPAAPGHIRAFDIRTGEMRWIFHTIPHPGETGFSSWEDSLAFRRVGGANSWSGLSLDPARGLVFAGTGSATFDFYGGDRHGDNLFANCVLALDAETGRYVWHYQTIHHDVWDRDLPAPPVLATIEVNGEARDVAIQATKTGWLFVLDRETGEPVFGVEEVEVPSESSLIGEKLAATQPYPKFPEPFMRQQPVWDSLRYLISDSSWMELMSGISKYNTGHIFTPPSEEGTIFFPGLDGGAEWGGSSWNENDQVLYINANEVPWVITNIRKTGDPQKLSLGARVYEQHCLSCHGPDLKGAGNYPGFEDLSVRMDQTGVLGMLERGKGMMPAFTFLDADEQSAVADYILNFNGIPEAERDTTGFRGYAITGYNKLQTREGLPAIDPPWGTLNAISLSTGKVIWKKPLGRHTYFGDSGPVTGTENYGGPVATAGGILFIGATPDGLFRVYRSSDGELLYETRLPAPAFATPSVYMAGGKQFVVIACGGGKLGTESGDYYVAFSL